MRTFLTISLLLTLNLASAQDPLTYGSADSLTYLQFSNKNYVDLRKTVRQALSQEIDFYYLRMRMGISYYDRKDYDSAMPHFRRAFEMNPANEVAREYYYYALLFSGRNDDAEDFASNLDREFKKRLGIKETKGPFSEVLVGAGAILNNNFQKNEGLISGSNEQIALSTFDRNTYFGSIVLKNKFSPRLSVFNGLTIFQSNATGVLKHPVLQGTATREYSNSFFQYNMQSVYSFPFGLRLGAAFGYYNEKSFLMSYDTGATNPSELILNLPYKHNAFSASLLAGLRVNRFDLFVSGSVSNLLSKKQKQLEFGIAVFPFGNQNLFLVSRIAYLDNSGDESIILSQKLGGKLSKNAWVEIEMEGGNMHGYLKSSGFVAFNTSNPVIFNSRLNLQLFFGKISVVPSFGLQQRKGELFLFSTSTGEEYFSEINNWNQIMNLSMRFHF